MSPPRVTVVLPTRDRAHCLARAVRSVVAQDFRDWELVLADDGSTDGTPALRARFAAALGPRRYREVVMPGLGPAAARNSALALASGEFVAFLDSDDMWLPQKLGMQLEALARDPEAGFSFTDFAEFDDEGRVGTAGHSIPPALKGAIYPALLEIRHNLITTPSVMVRRRLVAEAGGFDESMRLCEDIDLWARVARRTRCVPVRVPLVAVHVRPEAVFPYRASLAARLSLYRRAREADPGLALGFLAWLHEEMLQVYLQVAQARGDGEASALLLAAADRGRLALGAAPAARLSALEAAVAGLVASLAEAEPAGPTCGPVGRPHSGSPAPD